MHLTWQKGGSASVTALDGERITLSSTTPSAPGARVDGALASSSPIRVKVVSCKRQGASFTIAGRLLDGTRELRAEIAATLAPSLAQESPPGSGGPARP